MWRRHDLIGACVDLASASAAFGVGLFVDLGHPATQGIVFLALLLGPPIFARKLLREQQDRALRNIGLAK